MIKKIVLTAVGIATCITSATIFADNTPYTFGNTAGFFLSGSLGYGKVGMNNSPYTSQDLRGFTWMTNAGYQFCRYIALEGGYTEFDNAAPTQTNGLSAVIKGMYPIHQQWDLFGKIGAMRLNYRAPNNAHNTNYVPELGLGGTYNVNATIALTLQAIGTFAESGGVPATCAGYAGASYKFTV